MTWTVELTPRARKDLRKMEAKARSRVIAALERYASTGTGDVRKVQDTDPPEWRLRAGDWRARFHREKGRRVLIVLHIRRRDKAY